MGQQDLKIRELVDKIERGEIRLPEMQRQYVWRAPRVRDLLDSFYRGYPSGNILTWDTDASVNSLGSKLRSSDLANRNIRSAYFKTMFLAFRAEQAKDWQDQLVISLNHSGNKHALQFHHIFPQDVLKKADVHKQKINDICNLSFISGHTNRKISNKEPRYYLPELKNKNGSPAFNEMLSKQWIPNDESLWSIDKYDDFLKQRRESVALQLNAFIGSYNE